MNFFIIVSSLFFILFVKGELLISNEEMDMTNKLNRKKRIPPEPVNDIKNTLTITIPQNNFNINSNDQDSNNTDIKILASLSTNSTLSLSIQSDTTDTTTVATVFTLNTNKTNNNNNNNNSHVENDNGAPLIFPVKADKIITDLPPDEQKKIKHENESIIIVDNTTANIIQTTGEQTTQRTTTQLKINSSEIIAPIKESQKRLFKENDKEKIENKFTNKNNNLPSGIVALISTIGCVLTGVLVYVGLIFWKKYQERAYGNRELLVNDFDSSDINNFEL